MTLHFEWFDFFCGIVTMVPEGSEAHEFKKNMYILGCPWKLVAS